MYTPQSSPPSSPPGRRRHRTRLAAVAASVDALPRRLRSKRRSACSPRPERGFTTESLGLTGRERQGQVGEITARQATATILARPEVVQPSLHRAAVALRRETRALVPIGVVNQTVLLRNTKHTP